MPLAPQITSSGGGLYPATGESAADLPLAGNLIADTLPLKTLPVEIALDGSGQMIGLINPATGEVINFSDLSRQGAWFLNASASEMRALIRSDGCAFIPEEATMPNQVMVTKIRTDFSEFVAYVPVTADGITWLRHHVTNRFGGTIRLIRATIAYLWAATNIAPNAANLGAATEGQAPSVTQATAAATARVGTWGASGTVSGMTDIRQSTVTGDYVEYTITGVTRISQRHYGAGNGCFVAVYITESGVEIPANQYVTRPTKLVRHGTSQGQYHTPLAKNLNPALTYVVRLTRDASSTAGDRFYDGGLVGYTDLAFNAVGFWGPFLATNLGSPPVTYSSTLATGSRSVYQLNDTTQIQWRHRKGLNAGQVAFTVYDSGGTPIPGGNYVITTLDTYGTPESIPEQVMVAAGLAKGTYYLHVEVLNTKNASATDYQIYDFGVVAQDTTTAGVLGTTPFDLGGVIDTNSASGTRTILGRGGTFEQAVKVRKIGEDADSPTNEFVGGTHGFETSPTGLVMTVDGVVTDFAGAALNTSWIGAAINFSFETQLLFPVDLTPFARSQFSYTFTRLGYQCDITRTTLQDSIIAEDYALMSMVMDSSGPDAFLGGCMEWLSSPFRETLPPIVNDNSDHDTARRSVYWQAINPAYSAFAAQLNWPEIDEANRSSVFDGTRPFSFLDDRSGTDTKVYNRSFSGAFDGVAVPAGNVNTTKKLYFVALGAS